MENMGLTPKETFADRLNTALDEAGVPPKGSGRQVAVAKMFGVTQKGARKWLEGEAIPNTKRIPEIAARLHVRGEWLLTGQGAKTITAMPSGRSLSKRHKALLDLFDGLTGTQQDELLQWAEKRKHDNEILLDELTKMKQHNSPDSKQLPDTHPTDGRKGKDRRHH